MIEVVRVNLQDSGARYVLECIQGEGPFEAALSAFWRPQDGSVFALVPKGTKHDLAAFDQGGLALDPSGTKGLPVAADTTREMVAIIKHYFTAGSANICVFGDQLAGATDVWLATEQNRYTILGDRVFYPVSPDDSEEALLGACRSARHYDSFLGVLARVSVDTVTSLQQPSIRPEDLETTAANAVLIVASAYDGESFVFWQRDSVGAAVSRLRDSE